MRRRFLRSELLMTWKWESHIVCTQDTVQKRGKNTQAIVICICISNVDKKMDFEKLKRQHNILKNNSCEDFLNFRSSFSDSLPSHSTVTGALWGGQKRLHKSQLPYYSPSIVFITKRGNSFSLSLLSPLKLSTLNLVITTPNSLSTPPYGVAQPPTNC